MLRSINFCYLAWKFPNFTFKNHCLEIIGYNTDTGEYIIIDDGCCRNEEWCVHGYLFKNKEEGLDFFLNKGGYPINIPGVSKYLEKLFKLYD